MDEHVAPCVGIYHCLTNAAFPEGHSLSFTIPMVGTTDTVHVECFTDWRPIGGYDAPVPGNLTLELRGVARSVEEFASLSFEAPHQAVPFISVSSNCAIGDPSSALFYDASPEANVRRLVEVKELDRDPIPHVPRMILTPETEHLLQAVYTHDDRERLFRAISQYQMALDHWKPGDENRAHTHLWIGVEALTKVALRQYSRQQNVSEQKLQEHLGVERKRLDGRIRELIIFKGNTQTYKDAVDASDAFEHSFKPFHETRQLAEAARDGTARYLREAILRLSGLTEEMVTRLMQPPFDKPYGNWPSSLVVRGWIRGSSPRLAAEGYEHPFLLSQLSTKTYRQNELGDFEPDLRIDYASVIADGLEFEAQDADVLGP